MEMWPTDWLSVVCTILFIVYVGYVSLANVSAFYLSFFTLYKDLPKDLGDNSYPPVSIIKPLAGTDPNLKDNLETFFNLKYPKYEIIFCVHTKEDPSLEIVQQLMSAYPHVEALVFTDADNTVVNPKVNNMLQCYDSVKYDLLWISDANILVSPSVLIEMVTRLQSEPNGGLVHQMPYWASKPDFASCLNQVYFGTQHARMYLSSMILRQICASGASMLLKKSYLEDVGGLKHFGQYLAEDYFIAKAFSDKGYKIIFSSLPVIQNPGINSVGIFRRRLGRWIRLRTAMVPFPTLLEPVTECMVVGFLASLCFTYISGVSFVLSYLTHIAMWITTDYILLRRLENRPLLYWKQLFIAWWLRELLALPTFIQGVMSRTVKWKNRVYHLKWGGQVEVTVDPKPILNV